MEFKPIPVTVTCVPQGDISLLSQMRLLLPEIKALSIQASQTQAEKVKFDPVSVSFRFTFFFCGLFSGFLEELYVFLLGTASGSLWFGGHWHGARGMGKVACPSHGVGLG